MKKPPDIPRPTIEELALRYALEPTMRDVFVEGPSDQAILQWYTHESCPGNAAVAIYQIDDIDVPKDLLQQHGLTSGNRSEVLALCLELEKRCGHHSVSATGVVDLDEYAIIDGDRECALVLKSDFSCIEMYLFSDKCLQKMLTLVFPNAKRSSQDVIDELAPILCECFLARAANQTLGLGARWIALDRFAFVKGGHMQFRLEDFRRHYLQGSGVSERRSEFDAETEKLRAKLKGDFRFAANGHDAICLLGVLLKGFCKKSKDGDKTCPHVLVHFLTCSLETADVCHFPMFQGLLTRIAESDNK
jgi:hypothetical protein